MYKLNICDNRIRALKRGEFVDDVTGNVTIQPKVCDMNINKDGTVKDLNDEPGIPELMDLYLDDNYYYSNGTFTGMSDKTKQQFMNDLKTFYVAFTDNNEMPPEITKFSDIKLRDYRSKPGCQGDNPILKQKLTLNKKDKLFVEYAENIQKMIQSAANNQYKLLAVINDLFTYVIDPYSGKKVIRVNPKLTDELLQNCVVKTRRFIVDLYVKCETDYINGMKIYEAIVESQILDTTQKQIDLLKKQATKIINDTKKTVSPVKPTTSSSTISSVVTPLKQVEIIKDKTPNPLPAPVPTPVPAPVPAPVPNPVPTPVPNPVQAPVPNPVQAPVPNPEPAPTTTPVPNPEPAPVPNPVQATQETNTNPLASTSEISTENNKIA